MCHSLVILLIQIGIAHFNKLKRVKDFETTITNQLTNMFHCAISVFDWLVPVIGKTG